MKQAKFLDDKHTKFRYSPIVSIVFLKVQKSIPSVFSRRVYSASVWVHSKSAAKKTAKHKKTSRGKVSNQSLVARSKENNFEAIKKRSGVRKRLATFESL